jgi:hypothetical protein
MPSRKAKVTQVILCRGVDLLLKEVIKKTFDSTGSVTYQQKFQKKHLHRFLFDINLSSHPLTLGTQLGILTSFSSCSPQPSKVLIQC